MKSFRSFIQWLWKVITKLFWVLGLVPLAIDFLDAYIPKGILPHQLENYIQNGGTWTLTLIFGSFGLLISAYLVYIETNRNFEEMKRQIQEVEDRQPVLVVGFQDCQKRLVKDIQIILNPIVEEPDYAKLIEEKRKELINKARRMEQQNNIFDLGNHLNRLFESDLEEYLEKYEIYEKSRYAKSTFEDRVQRLYPILQNHGKLPANHIMIEFLMPKEYRWPTEDEQILYEYANTVELIPPDEPEIYKKSSIEAIKDLSIRLPSFSVPALTNYEMQLVAGNINGPMHKNKDENITISYSVKGIVPGHEETDFENIPLWLTEINESSQWGSVKTIV